MRIGIFTLHSNTNFGGGLQQIALFEVLKGLGHEPQVVCVQNNSAQSLVSRLLVVGTSYSFGEIIDDLKLRVLRRNRKHEANIDLYKQCDAFNYEHLNYTPKFGIADLPKYCENFDAIIFGSDQIWTDLHSSRLPYFGDGLEFFRGLRIAYAACSAHNKAPFYKRKCIIKLLEKFNAISVRDYNTANLVKNLGFPLPPMVADPTLLYDFERYIKPVSISEPYIFAYVLGNDQNTNWHTKNIERIRNHFGRIKVIALTTELNEEYPWADEILTGELAIDWMNLLRNARFIYTNSYHAVIFSLKFHKDFVAYYGRHVRSSRMLGLKQYFSLEDRIVKKPSAVDFAQTIDFIEVDKMISQLRTFSLKWLIDSLNIKL